MIDQTTCAKIIKIYEYVCTQYDKNLKYVVQRFSNNHSPKFTDQELMTIYLFATHEEKRFTLIEIYNFTKKYWLDWFPNLPSYAAFCNRLNRLSEAFKMLLRTLLQSHQPPNRCAHTSLADSLPVVLCSGKRQAKVAPNLADTTYNASKNLWYYGVKIHVLGFQVPNQMPHPEHIVVSNAAANDLVVMKENDSSIKNRTIFCDKAYCDKTFAKAVYEENNTRILTPTKAVKGQSQALNFFDKAANDLHAKMVSKNRQPVESLFAWLIQKTNIQTASNVRSEKGLLIHLFGKIAAAFINLIF